MKTIKFIFLLLVLARADAACAQQIRQPLWTFDSGGSIWSPLVHSGGKVYFGNDGGSFYSLNIRTHRPDWIFHAAGKIRSAAAVTAKTVMFASDDGHLYAVDRATGKPAWKFDLGDNGQPRRLPSNEPPYDFDYMASAPVFDQGTVYAGSADGYLYAINAEDGSLKWKFRTGGRIRATPLVHGDHVYVGSWDHKFYCIDRSSGQAAWEFETKDAIQASATYINGMVVFGGRDPRLFALDAETGKLVWTHDYTDGSWVESSAVTQGNRLYVGSSDAQKLSAFDAATGKEIWQSKVGGWAWMTPLVDGNTAYIGTVGASDYPQQTRAGFYAINIKDGHAMWKYEAARTKGYISGGVFARPAVTRHAILIADLDGTISAVAR